MAVGESAARWLRVSTGAQDEANQEPEIDALVQGPGYVVRKTYTLRGKRASKGQQDKALDQMIEDMRRGLFTVLVVWASDRIERRRRVLRVRFGPARQGGRRPDRVRQGRVLERGQRHVRRHAGDGRD